MGINKFLKDLSIQDYITLGYLYLVLLGIVNIFIYYSSFDINIFDYITITDILLAPVNMLFLSYEYTAMNIVVIVIITFLLRYLFFGINKLLKIRANKFNRPAKEIVYPPVIVFLILFSYVFLDLSVAMTESVSSGVKNMTYKLSTKLTFADNTQKDVRVIATTSVYLFYVEKGESVVTITPISGNVKAIKRNKID